MDEGVELLGYVVCGAVMEGWLLTDDQVEVAYATFWQST